MKEERGYLEHSWSTDISGATASIDEAGEQARERERERDAN